MLGLEPTPPPTGWLKVMLIEVLLFIRFASKKV
jgi:hypothetical protein